MRVVHVASEVAPWSQTGGLAHVVAALPDALVGQGLDCAVVTPLYRGVRERAEAAGIELVDSGVTVAEAFDGRRLEGRFLSARRRGRATVHFFDCPELYDRAGLYGDEAGTDYWDNPIRFAMLCRAALAGGERLLRGPVDLFHCHDWQTGLLPVYLRMDDGARAPRSVFTIHNLAFQGVFAKSAMTALGLDWSTFHLHGLEFFDKVNMLKGGAAFSDATTTVSPTYAREIETPEFGCGLDGFFAHRGGVVGILNGIDTEDWDPRTDSSIAANYSADDLAGKAHCRAALLDELELYADDGDLVLGVVSRFTEQKGIDLIADLAPQLHAVGARLVVLGNGDAELERRLAKCADWFSGHMRCIVGYDVALAHRITAGADAVLMPSRFEPCGLNQMYSMRYGTLPIVRSVGGLRDTVVDPGNDGLARGAGTGFCFERDDAGALQWAIGRAARLHREEPAGWRRAVAHAMTRDWSWTSSARRYTELYTELTGKEIASPPETAAKRSSRAARVAGKAAPKGGVRGTRG